MTAGAPPRAFAALRAFAASRPRAERCDLCAVEIGDPHDHLVDRASRRIACACAACRAMLGDGAGGRWTHVRPRTTRLVAFDLPEATWAALGVPVALAFFARRSTDGTIVASYPSPGGLVESHPDRATWDALVAGNPVLRGLLPDVEALLVRRVGPRTAAYVLSIDACYRLVGLIRRDWRGMSGGPAVEAEVEQFFAGLDRSGDTR
ncbi:MAG TPA: DUF5947 family protein [Terriglobales bacterium]|nr:DUF5947 family protein [Terriglobales bacterium]